MNDPYANPRSLETGFRSRRFTHVRREIEAVLARKERVRILDIGGTRAYWTIADDLLAAHAGRIEIALVNLAAQPRAADGWPFRQVVADACAPDLMQGERFDLVHSNSVIEHVGDWQRTEAFAANVKRLGARYFVQTPNYWFPLEPHFRLPGFQWLPRVARIRLVRAMRCGFYPRIRDYGEARRTVEEVRMLDAFEMRTLFPEARLERETVAGLTKSLMAIGDGAPVRRIPSSQTPALAPALRETAPASAKRRGAAEAA